MAPKVFHQYWDIPDGTDCHRKAYATTSIASVAGERRPGPEGGGPRPQGGRGVTGGCLFESNGAGSLAGTHVVVIVVSWAAVEGGSCVKWMLVGNLAGLGSTGRS